MSKLHIYKVEFIETLGKTTFSTFLNTKAKSEDSAKTKVIKLQRNLAKKYGKGSPGITILSVTRVCSDNEQILDRFWDVYPEDYITLWEPDITTKEMIEKLKETYPFTYRFLS